MPSYVIILAPEQQLYTQLEQLKQEAKSLVGDQLYLQDPPHITLFLGNFQEYTYFDEALRNTIAACDAPSFMITGWLVFPQDPVTKKDTLVCTLDEQSEAPLREIQKKIIDVLLPFKEQQHLKRYQDSSLQGAYQQNLAEYGYPFVGEDWKPHFGIASFDHEAFLKVWETFKNKCPLGTYGGKEVQLYALDEEEQLNLLTSYPFT